MDKTPSRTFTTTAPRVLFLGMRGEFSRLPLAALLAAGVDVRAVLVPGEDEVGQAPQLHRGAHSSSRETAPGQELPVEFNSTARPLAPFQRLVYQPPPRSTLPLLTRAHEPSIVTLAWERDIPVLEVRRERDPALAVALAAYQPDALCVACWPRRLPASMLALPRLGSLNLHPALLPLHRGPAPLFWTLRHGDAQAGITVHLMDTTLDGGDILAQEPIALEDGLAGAELERRCAEVGGRLLAGAVRALSRGTAHRTPQAAGAGSYESWPTEDDLIITPDRPARWAFNFIRGAVRWAGPLTIAVAGRRFVVPEALDYTRDGTVAGGLRLTGDEMWLACAPGVLHVTVEGV